MATLPTDDPSVLALARAIRTGDIAALRAVLAEQPDLANARIGSVGLSRTPLHIVTDWPGHFPDGTETVGVLVAAGADVNARFHGPHDETPLHWAASCDDVAVLDALLDAGADIDANGAVIAGGTALDDATAFGQWAAARRLVERGARVNYFAAASLGLLDALPELLDAASEDPDRLGNALWAACHGGQLAAAQYLLEQGADVDHLPRWERLTPLDAAARAEAHDVLTWLHARGAKLADQLRDR